MSIQVKAVGTDLHLVHTEGLMFKRGEPGSWDEAGVGSPVVSSTIIKGFPVPLITHRPRCPLMADGSINASSTPYCRCGAI